MQSTLQHKQVEQLRRRQFALAGHLLKRRRAQHVSVACQRPERLQANLVLGQNRQNVAQMVVRLVQTVLDNVGRRLHARQKRAQPVGIVDVGDANEAHFGIGQNRLAEWLKLGKRLQPQWVNESTEDGLVQLYQSSLPKAWQAKLQHYQLAEQFESLESDCDHYCDETEVTLETKEGHYTVSLRVDSQVPSMAVAVIVR